MFLLILLAILIPILPEKVIIGLTISIFLAYGLVRETELRITGVNPCTSYFNTLLLAAAITSTMLVGIPRSVIGAAVFLSAFHGERGAIKNIILFTACGLAYFVYFYHATKQSFSFDYLFFLSLTGALAASLVESVETKSDKRTTLLLAAATTYLIFTIYALKTTLLELAMAFTIAFALSLAATKSGLPMKAGC